MHKHTKKEVDIIPKIMKFFSLEIPWKIKVIPEGLSNRNYFVKTRNKGYFVKFIGNQNVKLIKNDIAIQNQLQKGDILTPMYLKNQDGRYIFQENDFMVVVSEKIEGITPRKVNKSLAFSIGEVLAKFHTLVKKLPYDIKGWMDVQTSEIISDDVKKLKNTELPLGITHGDMHNGNVLILRNNLDEVYAILDFEEVGRDLLLVDLARSIIGVCYTEDGNRLDSDLVKAELNGYESIRALTDHEKSVLSSAINYAAEVCIKWFIDNGYEKYVDNHKSRAKSFVSPFDING
ncbi:phosphotransferase [Patescibacteria group bacterium]